MPLNDISTDTPDRWVGLSLLLTTLERHKWLIRRNETVEFVGESRVQRNTIFECTIPDPPQGWPSERAFAQYLPLSLIVKEPLCGFDLTSGAGIPCPLPPWDQRVWAVWSLLVVAAEGVLRRPLPDSTVNRLRSIVSSEDPEARRILNEWDGSEGPDGLIGTELASDPVFRRLLEDLTSFTVLLVVAEPSDSPFRVFKLSFDEPILWSWAQRRRARGTTTRIGLQRRLGWRRTPLEFLTPGLGDVNSYHFEIESPGGLEIVQARMYGLAHGKIAEKAEDTNALGSRAHLHLRGLESETGTVIISMRPAQKGIMGAALILGLFTAVLMTVGAFLPAQLLALHQQAGAAGGLLLLVPGIVAAYMATAPGEHVAVSKILLPVRVLLLLLGLICYLAAGTLVLRMHEESLSMTWKVFAVAAWACYLSFLVSRLVALRRGGEKTEVAGRRLRRRALSRYLRRNGFGPALAEGIDVASQRFRRQVGIPVEEAIDQGFRITSNEGGESASFGDMAFVIGSIERGQGHKGLHSLKDREALGQRAFDVLLESAALTASGSSTGPRSSDRTSAPTGTS